MPAPHDHELADPQVMAAVPRVSVLVITYNQQDYVAAAVESALAQVAPFAVEIVIGEDSSTDATRSICRDLQTRHPDRVRLLWSESNLGFHENFRRTLAACRAPYVALLEGDDLWTDPAKLAAQVAALDEAGEVDICVTRGRRLFANGRQEGDWDRGERARIIPIAELAAGDGMMAPTASIMARREALQALPGWVAEAPVLDSFLILALAARHGALYLPLDTCLYRQFSAGSWSQGFERHSEEVRVDYTRRMLAAYAAAAADFDIDPALLRRRLSSFHLLLARDAWRRGAWAEAMRYCARLDRRYLWHGVRRRLRRT